MKRHDPFVILCAVLIGVLFVTPAQATNRSDGPNIAEMAIAESTATKLNAPLVTGGNVGAGRISPDNSTVVYRADQDTDGVDELYSVPIGGGPVTKLNDPLVSGGDVTGNFRITPDSSTVVYLADQETNGVNELYSVPIGGGTVTKLNDPLPNGGGVFSFDLSPDSSTVVYAGEQETDGVNELFSVPIGGGPVTKLNDPLVSGGNILNTRAISPDSSTVVYLADQETDGVNELFSVPIGGGPVTKLNDPLVNGGDVEVFGLSISADSSTVVYRADQDTNNKTELYSVPIGGGSVTTLNDPLVSEGDVRAFQISPNSSTVVYRADQDTNNKTELYSVPIGGGTVTKLNDPASAGLFNFSLSPDSSTVVYQTSTGGSGVDELFSVPIGGGTVTKLNAPLPDGETVDFFRISTDSSTVVYMAELIGGSDDPKPGLFSVPIGGGTVTQLNAPFEEGSGVDNFGISPDSRMVVYEADQETAGVFELFHVPIAGGPITKLNDPLVSGGDVSSFLFSSDSRTVLYSADQDTDEVDELYSVSLEIALNEPPVAADDTYSTDPDTPLTVPAPGVLGNDTDADDDALTTVLVSGPSNGMLTLNADGSFTYTPNVGFSGGDSFTYQADDGREDSNVATVAITVDPVPNQAPAPVATDDTYSTNSDTPLTVPAPGVLANDTNADADAVTAVLVSGPRNGTLNLNADGSFTYTPNAGFSGRDAFTYQASDGREDSNVATVTITVTSFTMYLPLILK